MTAAYLSMAALIAGCSIVSDVALETAALDLSCPPKQVRVEETGPRQYLATDCGHYLKYACYDVGKAQFKCFPDQPAQPQDVRELGGPGTH